MTVWHSEMGEPEEPVVPPYERVEKPLEGALISFNSSRHPRNFNPETVIVPRDVYYDARWSMFQTTPCICGTCGGEGPSVEFTLSYKETKSDKARLCKTCWSRMMDLLYG